MENNNICNMMDDNNMLTKKIGPKVALCTRIIMLLGASSLVSLVQAAPEIQHWQTKNGARVYFVPAPEIEMVDVRVIFDGGSARDGKKLGISIMTNGMLAEGAAGMNSDQISEGFESLGARFSNSAHRDMTLVGLRSLTESDKLQPALKLMTSVLNEPTFPKVAFERERKRLLVSIEQSKQSPRAIGSEAFFDAVYQGHPYGSVSIGNKDTVKALTIKDLQAFYKQYYVSKNAVVAIVGAIDKETATKIAEQVVGSLPTGIAAPKLPEVKFLPAGRTINISHPSSQTHVTVGQPGVKRGDVDYFSMYVGNHILGGSGLTSRLAEEIREKRGLVYSAYSGLSPMRESGPYTFGLQTRNDSAEEALKILVQEMNKFVNNGPTSEELNAAKKNITGGFPLRISSNSKIVGYIGMIGFYQLPLNYLDVFNANIEKVTIKSIKEAFQRRVHTDKMITVLVGGGKKS